MPEPGKTFSESWYRIARQRLALRPQVQMRRQFFRGRKWYVLRDPFSNQFFRLHPAAHAFVARLRRDHTVEEIWQQVLDLYPDEAPGQQEVLNLLAQLFFANLLQCDNPADSAILFERHRRRRQQETKGRIFNIMFARFPLLDPDRFLVRLLPLTRVVVSWAGAVVWLAVFVGAIKIVLDNFPELREQTQAVLAPANLPLLYVALILIKACHEFGHAFVCRRFGGEVHTMGVMLLIFTPLPYMDATSSWAFRNRWTRAFVGAAGMIVELFIAACAAFVWANTGPGTVHSIAYNMMFIASVSTVLFNVNPLLRFDGYYILSDVLDIPNLHTQATQQLRHLAEHYLFGCKDSESPTLSRKEAFWLTVFGILSHIYRIFVFTGIILTVASRFLLAGIVMAVICFFSWVVTAIGRFVKYLAASPRLERTRPRAVAVTLALLAAVVLLVRIIPYPYRFRAPGIMEAKQHTFLATETDGYLGQLLAQPGSTVSPGQPLLQLRSVELDLDLQEVEAQLQQARALRRRALDGRSSDLKPIESHIQAVRARQEHLRHRHAALTVRAPHTGLWVAPNVEQLIGAWLPKGTATGEIINPASFVFSAIVSQREASALFAQEIRRAEVKVRGQAAETVPVSVARIIPVHQEVLPSPALGWQAGGEVAVDTQDPQGVKAAEPFFEVRVELPQDSPVPLMHGRSGKIRFEFSPRPLLDQWWIRFRQMLQKRYKI